MTEHITLPEVKLFRQAIGSKIKQARELRSKTILELSELSGLTEYAIDSIEKGRWPVNIDQLRQLSVALNFDIVFELR